VKSMYLHIGQDVLVAYQHIVGIFDRDLLESSTDFRHYYHRLRQNNQIVGDPELAKSVIVTPTHLYFSPISASTLWRRAERDPSVWLASDEDEK